MTAFSAIRRITRATRPQPTSGIGLTSRFISWARRCFSLPRFSLGVFSTNTRATDPQNIAARKQRIERAKIEERRQQAEHILERDRLAVEYASRILNQRDSLIQIQERMASQLTQLDARQREINRILGGGDLLELMTSSATRNDETKAGGEAFARHSVTGGRANASGQAVRISPAKSAPTPRKAKNNGNLNDVI